MPAAEEMGGGGRNGARRQYNRSKEPRMRWTPELNRSFVRAIECLGGQDSAFGVPFFFLLLFPSSCLPMLCSWSQKCFSTSCV